MPDENTRTPGKKVKPKAEVAVLKASQFIPDFAHIRQLADFFHISPAAFFESFKDRSDLCIVALLPGLSLISGLNVLNCLHLGIGNGL